MDALQCNPDFPSDPEASIKAELVTVQLTTWLLEERARLVRQELQRVRSQRARLGRAYRRLVFVPTTSHS